MPFDGLRVLALESRRAAETERLIRAQGGDPFVAPSMREAPLDQNDEVFRFAGRLSAGEFDMMIFLTGVGTRALNKLLAPGLAEALRRLTVVARGPKPTAALREMDVPITVIAPEPNTWRELLAAIQDRPEKRIAVQEYGRSKPEFLAALRARPAEVTPVRIYQWDLPEDTGPLREAVRRIAACEVDVVLFTTAIQVVHLFRIAREMGLERDMEPGLGNVVVGSIGPATTEMLEEFGVKPDLEPSHPKLGFLVKETADQAAVLLSRKR